MENLTPEEAHVMRRFISSGHDHCVPHVHAPAEVLAKLVERGWMENPYGDVHRLTEAGKAVTLRDLR